MQKGPGYLHLIWWGLSFNITWLFMSILVGFSSDLLKAALRPEFSKENKGKKQSETNKKKEKEKDR